MEQQVDIPKLLRRQERFAADQERLKDENQSLRAECGKLKSDLFAAHCAIQGYSEKVTKVQKFLTGTQHNLRIHKLALSILAAELASEGVDTKKEIDEAMKEAQALYSSLQDKNPKLIPLDEFLAQISET